MGDSRLSTMLMTEAEFEDDILEDPKTWRRSYLYVQCALYEIEDVYKHFKEKIQHGFFTLFLLLQAFLSLVHFFLVLCYNLDEPTNVVLDLTLYALLVILASAGLFIKEQYLTNVKVEKNGDEKRISASQLSTTESEHGKTKFGDSLVTLILSFSILFILLTVNLTIPLYHLLESHKPNLRPAYATLSIIACYVFFPISKDLYAVILGATATVCNIIVIACVTYKDSENFASQITSDVIYYVCINVVFLILRFLNEIMRARTFLERYYGIQKKYRLDLLRDKEDALLTRIIPPHVANEVKDIIRSSQNNQFVSTGISEYEINRFFTKYDNVTILYADIVHYTAMTTGMDVTELVEILTDLFGNFDKASAANNVLRIKFLGDCYYCVAGIPVIPKIPDEDSYAKRQPKLSKTKTHADNAVALGLDMIRIIRSVRTERNKSKPKNKELIIDMRIGVHSGSIWGGIIGRTKWQYDIWSKDVIIANRMESTGVAGKVHLSQETKDILKMTHGDGEIIENSETINNEDLQKLGICNSYLISPKEENTMQKERVKSINARASLYKSDIKQSRTTIEDTVIIQYQEIAKYCKENMEKAISQMQLNKFKQWFQPEDINPFLLMFYKTSNISNMGFFKQPDPLFKYYIAIAAFVSFCLILLQHENWFQTHWSWENTLPYVTFGLLFCVLVPTMWLSSYKGSTLETSLKKISMANLKHSITRNRKPHNEFRTADNYGVKKSRSRHESTNTYEDEEEQNFFARMSDYITNTVSVRIGLYLLTCILFAVSTLTALMVCSSDYDGDHSNNAMVLENPVCKPSWSVTLAFALVLFMNFLFYKINVWLKFAITFISTCLYIYFILSTDIFEGQGSSWNINIPQEVSHITSVVFLAIILHLIDRQTEYMNRLGFKWHYSIIMEQNNIYKTRAINHSLLTNILPKYIAQIYINKEHSSMEVYHKSFRRVAVMFASVVYSYNIDDLNDKRSLETMNTIISGFDKLLLTNSKYVDTVEKIKISGWTYMAACGVIPEENNLTSKRRNSAGNRNPLCIMVDFAGDMMEVLDEINQRNNSDFKLRVGIAFGPVQAGVVGSKKPFYDIWGDAVNMASRMDSTGVCGKIQVTEVAKTELKVWHYECEYRDQIYVKGKGKIPTYFVKPQYVSSEISNLVNDSNIASPKKNEKMFKAASSKQSPKRQLKNKSNIDAEISYL